MSKFDKVMEFVLKWEGGYVNNPNDPGGRTNMGVSERSHPEAWADDVVTEDEAKAIYRQQYWEPIGGDDRPYPEALAVMDFAVHSGTSRALKYWRANPDVCGYIIDRFEFLTSLRNYEHFGRGWKRRITDLQREVSAFNTSEVELIQLYTAGGRYDFAPEKVSVGRTQSDRLKIMARV